MAYRDNILLSARSQQHCFSLIEDIKKARLKQFLGNVASVSLTDSGYCSELLLFLETWNADSHSYEIELQ